MDRVVTRLSERELVLLGLVLHYENARCAAREANRGDRERMAREAQEAEILLRTKLHESGEPFAWRQWTYRTELMDGDVVLRRTAAEKPA